MMETQRETIKLDYILPIDGKEETINFYFSEWEKPYIKISNLAKILNTSNGYLFGRGDQTKIFSLNGSKKSLCCGVEYIESLLRDFKVNGYKKKMATAISKAVSMKEFLISLHKDKDTYQDKIIKIQQKERSCGRLERQGIEVSYQLDFGVNGEKTTYYFTEDGEPFITTIDFANILGCGRTYHHRVGDKSKIFSLNNNPNKLCVGVEYLDSILRKKKNISQYKKPLQELKTLMVSIRDTKNGGGNYSISKLGVPKLCVRDYQGKIIYYTREETLTYNDQTIKVFYDKNNKPYMRFVDCNVFGINDKYKIDKYSNKELKKYIRYANSQFLVVYTEFLENMLSNIPSNDRLAGFCNKIIDFLNNQCKNTKPQPYFAPSREVEILSGSGMFLLGKHNDQKMKLIRMSDAMKKIGCSRTFLQNGNSTLIYYFWERGVKRSIVGIEFLESVMANARTTSYNKMIHLLIGELNKASFVFPSEPEAPKIDNTEADTPKEQEEPKLNIEVDFIKPEQERMIDYLIEKLIIVESNLNKNFRMLDIEFKDLREKNAFIAGLIYEVQNKFMEQNKKLNKWVIAFGCINVILMIITLCLIIQII